MAGPGFGLFLLVLLVSVGMGLVLYALVRAEREDRSVMRREQAERAARRDTGDSDE